MRLKDYIQSDNGQLITNLATGTAPLAVSSTTKVANLNVDKIDDLDSNDFIRAIRKDGWYQMAGPGGDHLGYIRTTIYGLLPNTSSGTMAMGHSDIGAQDAPFASVWAYSLHSLSTHVNNINVENIGALTLYNGDTTYMIAMRSNLGTLLNSNNTYGIAEGLSMFFTINDDTNRGWIFRRGATNVAGITGNGTYLSTINTQIYLAGNQGKVIIDSTAVSGTQNAYVMLFRQSSSNGVFTGGSFRGAWELHYTDNTTITNGKNAVTHSLQLIDEFGITKLKRLYIANNNVSGINEDNISGYSLYTQGDARINGPLSIQSNKGGFREGIRIYPYSNWSDIILLGSDSPGTTGITANSWLIGNNNGNFYLTRAGSKTANPVQLSCVNNIWNITGTSIFRSFVQIQHSTASLYIKDTSDDTYSILFLGNKDRANASGIWLNSATRTDDGGPNMMTIRNNVGALRLDNNVLVTGDLTASHLIGNADTATKLATPRTFTIGATGKTFDGSTNVSWTPYEMRVTRALYNTDSQLNAFAQRGCSIGMLNLAGTDATINPNAQTGWHHVFQATWHDCADNNNNTSNEWCSQIAVKAGTDQWYVRSRDGGTIANGTAWKSNWRRLVTSNIGAVGNAGQPIYVNGAGEAVAIDWHVGNKDLGEHNANNITYNMIGYYSSNGPDVNWQLTYKNGGIYSQAYSSGWVTQMAQSYVYGELYIRSKNNNGWQPWQKVIDTKNMGELFTTFNWTDGTTRGPTINAVIGGTGRSATIPAASTEISGVVTTGAQTFAGDKTFTGNLRVQKDWASLTLKNLSTTANSAAILHFSNSQDNRDDAAIILLNGPERTNDGGPNLMTIRNNVGDLRLDDNLFVTGITHLQNNLWVKAAVPKLYIKDTSDTTESYSILYFGNANRDYAAYMWLNGPQRTVDGGANTLNIRNDVGDLRLADNTSVDGTLTVRSNLVLHSNVFYTNGSYGAIQVIGFNQTGNHGCGIVIGAGGSTVLGSGESATLLASNLKLNSDQENTYISADQNIYFYTAYQNSTNTYAILDNSLNFYPATNGAGSLGTSANRWNNVFTNNLTATTTISAQWLRANMNGSGSDGGVTLWGGIAEWMIAARNNLGILANSNNTFGINHSYAMFFTINDVSNRGWIFRRGTTNVAGITGYGTYLSSVTTNSYLAGNQGRVIIDSTIGGTYPYVMLFRQKSTNGVFTGGVYRGDWELHYTDDTTITNGENKITHSIQLLDEVGITRLKRLYVANNNMSGINTDDIAGYSFYSSGLARIQGNLHIFPPPDDWAQGIRIHTASNGWTNIALCGDDNTGNVGTSAKTWSINTNQGNFYISKNGAADAAIRLDNINNEWHIIGNTTFPNNVNVTGTLICNNTANLKLGFVSEQTLAYGTNALQFFWTQTTVTSGADVAVVNPVADRWYGHLRMGHFDTRGFYIDLAAGLSADEFYIRRVSGGTDQGWVKFWHDRNMGAGSGLNADLLDGYHASNLWRSDGATWNPGANVSCKGTSEWSFDIEDTGTGGAYWHVWSTNLASSMIQCYPYTGHVFIPHHLAVGGYDNTRYTLSTHTFISNSWVRTKGDTGWYSEDHGGGWHMTDNNWIRAYGNKGVYSNGDMQIEKDSSSILLKNTEKATDTYSVIRFGNKTNTQWGAYVILNGSQRTNDGGPNTMTIRNNVGDLRLNNNVNITGRLSVAGVNNPDYGLATTSLICTNNAYVAGRSDLVGNVILYNDIYYANGSYNDLPVIKFQVGANAGCGIRIGGGGYVIIGSGESADNLRNNLNLAGTAESTYIAADHHIQFYTNCQTIDDKKGATLDSSLNFYPMVNATGSLGTSANKWGNIYASMLTVDNFSINNSLAMSGDILFSNSGTTTRQIRGIVGDNDYWRIAGGATATNAGWMEIATADDGIEPIYVRQYTGAFSKITRTLTLLDGSGNSNFPGTVSVANQLKVQGNSYFSSYVYIQHADISGVYIQSTSNTTNSYSILHFGNSSNAGAAYIFLNGPQRVNDGGVNTLTIRNNVGDIRLNNNVRIEGTAKINNTVRIYPATGNFCEGIRIYPCNDWCDIVLCGSDAGVNGISTNSWYIGNNNGKFYLTRAGAETPNPVSLSCVENKWKLTGAITVTGNLTAAKVYGAVWNDYAEYRQTKNQKQIEPGRAVLENGDDTISISNERLAPGGMIVSDTFGFAIGQIENICETPIAVSGRVLAYPYEDRNSYNPGDAVCTGPNGTVSKMTREEIKEYPERIIGTVSAIPNYETWGTDNVPVNGRIWIKVR